MSETKLTDWQPIETAPENVVVETKIDDEAGPRNEAPLLRSRRLWFYPDRSMYVYYTPTHWRALSRAGEGDGEADVPAEVREMRRHRVAS